MVGRRWKRFTPPASANFSSFSFGIFSTLSSFYWKIYTKFSSCSTFFNLNTFGVASDEGNWEKFVQYVPLYLIGFSISFCPVFSCFIVDDMKNLRKLWENRSASRSSRNENVNIRDRFWIDDDYGAQACSLQPWQRHTASRQIRTGCVNFGS